MKCIFSKQCNHLRAQVTLNEFSHSKKRSERWKRISLSCKRLQTKSSIFAKQSVSLLYKDTIKYWNRLLGIIPIKLAPAMYCQVIGAILLRGLPFEMFRAAEAPSSGESRAAPFRYVVLGNGTNTKSIKTSLTKYVFFETRKTPMQFARTKVRTEGASVCLLCAVPTALDSLIGFH